MIDTEKLQEVARDELVCLWGDLKEARNRAYRNAWSMGCDNIVERIKALTPLVGSTLWGEVPIALLEDGIYQRVHEDLGVEVTVDMAAVAECRAYLAAQGTSS